ncbi:MAG: alpha/beta hydrolase [bacterium]|nr:alpha/beta hydrolase [bacterium]
MSAQANSLAKNFSISFPMSRYVLFFIFLIFSFLILSPLAVSNLQAATPPPQPRSGPGGSDYPHAAIISSVHGQGNLKYYLFEPDEPKPESAPLVIFAHGWGGINPTDYGSWINHLVRRGNIVIYPVYQTYTDMFTGFSKYTANCMTAIKDALRELKRPGHVAADLDKVATVGHSLGGLLAVNIAASWAAEQDGAPAVKAIMSVEPGGVPALPLEDLSLIAADTLLLTVVGDQDQIAGSRDARKIFYRTSQIPPQNKDFITLVSDQYGEPALIADHFAPTCELPIGSSFLPSLSEVFGSLKYATNALDFYGTWKLFDALTEAAFYGKNREYALGNTPQQRFMGEWSDGRPVQELVVTDQP